MSPVGDAYRSETTLCDAGGPTTDKGRAPVTGAVTHHVREAKFVEREPFERICPSVKLQVPGADCTGIQQARCTSGCNNSSGARLVQPSARLCALQWHLNDWIRLSVYDCDAGDQREPAAPLHRAAGYV